MTLTRDKNAFREALAQLAELLDGEWEQALGLARCRELQQGECWLTQDEVPTSFAWVAEGLVRKFRIDAEGREVTRGFGREGDWVAAYASLLQGSRSSLRIEALEPTRLVELDYAAMRALLGSYNWERRARVLAEAALLEREWRESWLFERGVVERRARVSAAMPWLEARVSQRIFASYLGVTPVSLSRAKRRLH